MPVGNGQAGGGINQQAALQFISDVSAVSYLKAVVFFYDANGTANVTSG